MQDSLVTGWKALNQQTVELYRQMAEAQSAAVAGLADSVPGAGVWAQMAKVTLDASQAVASINKASANGLLRTQLGAIDTGGAATAVKQFGDIGTGVISALVQQQTSLVEALLEAGARRGAQLQQVQSAEDLAAVQTAACTDAQETLKKAALDTLQTLASARAALTAWLESTVEQAAAPQATRANGKA